MKIHFNYPFQRTVARARYRHCWAIVVVLVSSGIRGFLLRSVWTDLPFLTFYPAVMLAAFYGGLSAGLLASVLSVLAADILCFASVSDGLRDPREAIFLFICVILSILAEAFHSAQVRTSKADAQIEVSRINEQAKESMRKSESRHRSLFESNMDAVLLTDLDGGIIAANPAACAMFGMSESDLCRVGRAGVVDSAETRLARMLEERSRRGRVTGELTCVRKNGIKFPAEISSVVIDETGLGCFVIIRDLTDRKLSEQALLDSEERYRRLFQVELDAIFLVDCETEHFVDANPAALKLYGYTREEFHLLTFRNLLAESDKASHAIPTEETFVSMGWHRKKDDTVFPVEIACTAFVAEGRRLHVAAIRDITERKRIEEELRALAARVQDVREEERIRVAREIHDVLAQDLTILKIEVSLLTRSLSQLPTKLPLSPFGEKLAGMTTLIDKAIQAVQKIATELRPVVLDTLGLCAAIEWQAREFQSRTGIVTEAILPVRDLSVSKDQSTALFRIMQESLTNVARHSKATLVEVTLQLEPGFICLIIQDNGCGITPVQASAPESIGLLGMRERVLIFGGLCQITGLQGGGTKVEARLPFVVREISE